MKAKYKLTEIKEMKKLSKILSINPKYRKLDNRKLVFYIFSSSFDVKLKVAVY
jgi:hypothetical protein